MKSIQQKNLLLEQLKKTPIVQIAAEKANVSRASYYRWRLEDSEFAKRADEALYDGKMFINDMAESQLISAIKDKNLGAILAWLRAHHNDYKNRVELEGTINTIQELSSEQQALVKKALDLITSKFYGNAKQ